MKVPTTTIIQGHCLDKLRDLPAASVHCCVTSPPYWGLRDYKIPPVHWPEITFSPMPGLPPMTIPEQDAVHGLEPDLWAYVGHEVAVFREVRRVLREDGTLWLNLGDSYAARADQRKSEDAKGPKQCSNRGSCDTGSRDVLDLKPKDLVGIPWHVAFALQADGWWLRMDNIWHKCLSGGTRVYARTAKGDMPTTIKDLVRLNPSTVKLWNGAKWTQAVSWSQSPRTGTEVELVLRSGERIGCTQNHVWPTTRGSVRTDSLLVGDVIQTCHLPNPEFPRNPSGIPDEIGWFVGLYIAEGSQSEGTIQIAGHVNESTRFNQLKKLAESFHGYCFFANTGGNAATVNINSPVLLGILNAYVSGRTAKDKHLDVRCWKRGDGFLSSVLSGYLDGDGHADGDRWKIGFCANDNLSADLRTLCARLGLSIRLKRTFHTCTNAKGGPKRFPGWRGEIREKHRENGGEVVAIEKSRARKFWDITVEDDPHTFALASGVLTHNSNPMPESVTDRPTKAHEYFFLLAKSERYFYDAEAIKESSGYVHRRSVSAVSRNGTGRNDHDRETGDMGHEGSRNKRSVWTVPSAPYREAHFATFPPDLIKPAILAATSARGCCPKCGTPWERVIEKGKPLEEWKRQCGADSSGEYHGHNQKNYEQHLAQPASSVKERILKGMVERKTVGWKPSCDCFRPRLGEPYPDPIPCTTLDPFLGSGTTTQVSLELARSSIGIELNPSYISLALARSNVTPCLPLA